MHEVKMSHSGTLLRPPPPDPNKSQIENALEVIEIGEASNIFSNKRALWHPSGSRGIYGGAVIAMCLAAAQKTVPDDFVVHSCHCYFLLAGSGEQPILMHVEKVRDGLSFATRTVQVHQRGRCIFTTTMSFARRRDTQARVITHAAPMPPAMSPPPDHEDGDPAVAPPVDNGSLQWRPVETTEGAPHERRSRHWVRVRGPVAGGHTSHLAALAYLSDAMFIGTVGRVHGLFRSRGDVDMADLYVRRFENWLGVPRADEGRSKAGSTVGLDFERSEIGMFVSLDHSIYFHAPMKVRADEWMLVDIESPWAGDERGLVMLRIFSREGVLLATCVQEGLVRLKKRDTSESKL